MLSEPRLRVFQWSRRVGSLHNSTSVLSKDQIDDVSPFAPPRWIPAFAGMTVGVHTSEWERDDAGATACAFLSAIRVICWVMVYRCKMMRAGLGASEEY